jgi:hypothetical protein
VLAAIEVKAEGPYTRFFDFHVVCEKHAKSDPICNEVQENLGITAFTIFITPKPGLITSFNGLLTDGQVQPP